MPTQFPSLNCLTCVVAVVTVLVNSGCATPVPIAEGEVLLREVAHVLSRQEIVSGEVRATRDNHGKEPINWPDLRDLLLENGMQDREMVDGSVILGRTQYYWHNVLSGIVRQYVRASPVAPGLEVNVGNVVEMEQRGKFAKVVRVKYKSLTEGRCDYRTRDGKTMSDARTLSPINLYGSPGAVSLFCADLAAEGWKPNEHVRGLEWSKQPQKKQ